MDDPRRPNVWHCPLCGEAVEDAFDTCWRCGAGKDGIAAADFQREPDDPSVTDPGPKPERAEPEPGETVPTVADDARAEDLVTIATYDVPLRAEVERLLLEDEGIPTFLADDNVVKTNWFLSNAVGGAKLQVAASQAERATKILEAHRASRTGPHEGLTGQFVTFVCEACGEPMTFPAERCGHVETCPSCGDYVDVPDAADGLMSRDHEVVSPQAAAGLPDAAGPRDMDPDSRTDRRLWTEVFAVLCLAYIPGMYSAIALASGLDSGSCSFVFHELDYIVMAIKISVPLLVIVAWAGDPWSRFGIIRPRWIVDPLGGCVLCIAGVAAYDFTRSLMPEWLLGAAAGDSAAQHLGPEGPAEYLLLLVACLAGGFAEELAMRGYLIPRLERLLRSSWLAIVVSSVLFGSYHIYHGVAPAIGLAATGLVYGVAFWWFRRLWPLCLAHALTNFTIYL